MKKSFLLLLALAGSQMALAAETRSSAIPVNKSGMSPVIADNATASAVPARATTPTPAQAGSSDTDSSPTITRRKLDIKARLDDGRYMGFHQNGGDQPAGDQKFRPPGRVQAAEKDRISRESRDKPRDGAAIMGGSTPAVRDQSTIIKTQ